MKFDYNLLIPSSTTYSPPAKRRAPSPPWDVNVVTPPQSEVVKIALRNRELIDVARQEKRLGARSEDYAELFALYNGLTFMDALAKRADAKGVSPTELKQLERRFASGMKEVGAFVDGLALSKLKLIRGEAAESARTGAGVPRTTPEYATEVVHRGDRDAAVAAWSGEVKFQVTVSVPPLVINTTDEFGRPKTLTTQSSTPPKTVSFDLAEMGGPETRTVAAVVNYMNDKLKAAGVYTQLERVKVPEPPRTVKVGDRTVTLPAGPDAWALKVKGALSEQLSFNAPASADSVYIAQVAGKSVIGEPQVPERQILKFQSNLGTGAPDAPVNTSGQANWVEGQVFSKSLDADVAAVRASATGADGSVYMVAEITGPVSGESIKGQQDVALLKYDSAGRLLWSRSLGADEAAKATAVAVGADGKVAIGGSVTGGLQDAGTIGTLNDKEAGQLRHRVRRRRLGTLDASWRLLLRRR
jgi:hypothetical protein